MTMNDELAKLLSQGQTAPASVAGTPVANALKKLMGGQGAGVPIQEQGPMSTPTDAENALMNALGPEIRGNPDVIRQMKSGDRAILNTERYVPSRNQMNPENLIGGPKPPGHEMDMEMPMDYKFQGNRKTGPTPMDKAFHDRTGTDSIEEEYEKLFTGGRPGRARR